MIWQQVRFKNMPSFFRFWEIGNSRWQRFLFGALHRFGRVSLRRFTILTLPSRSRSNSLPDLHCPGEKAEVSLENESGQRGVVDRLPFLAVAMRAMMKLEIPELG